MTEKKLALIPARGGSKRIPGKNIRPFAGRPIITYSIQAALESGLFNEVMVSTDSDEIAEVARKAGAAVPFKRSNKTANDTAIIADVIREVMGTYTSDRDLTFDAFCLIFPSAPFITPAMLKESYRILTEKEHNAVFPVVRFSYPIQRALQIEDGKLKMIWPENYTKRSQDLTPAYHEAGLFFWMLTNAFHNCTITYMDNTGALEIPENEVHDIDTEADWQAAEMKYKMLHT